MARQSMGDTKKTPAKSSAKASKATSKTTTKREVAKKPVKAAASVKKTSVKQSAAKKSVKKKASVLEIADHGVLHAPVAEKVVQNVKKSEHWHAGLFALVVILAAYFSYQASNEWAGTPVNNTAVVANTVEEEDEPTPVVATPTVQTFNFPNDYAWLTQQVSDDLNLAPGASGEYTIQVRNSGKAIWYRDADVAFRMGTLSPADSLSPFMIASATTEGASKVSPGRNRIEMMQAQVAPGETATFKVIATAKDWNGANLKPGTYRLTVGFMVEGEGSLSKQPLTWLMNVR